MKALSGFISDSAVDNLYHNLLQILHSEEDSIGLKELIDRLDEEKAANMTKVRKMLDFVYSE